MKKFVFLALLALFLSPVSIARAEDQTVPPAEDAVPTAIKAVADVAADVAPVTAPVEAAVDAPVAQAVEATAAAPVPAPVDATAKTAAAENLEFVSGEVTALDETAKKITVKLYGETDEKSEKSVTIQLDQATDITDGEKDRDIKSLTAGTEVDVEYDPATSKATYIFVY